MTKLAALALAALLGGCVSVSFRPVEPEPVTTMACGIAMAADPLGPVALGVCCVSLAVDLARSIEVRR
jgi:hypothetical protein